MNSDDYYKIRQSFNDIGKNTLYFSNKIAEAVKPASITISELAEKLKLSIDSKSLQDTFKKIAEGLSETEEDVNNYKIVMLMLGYPPTITLDIGIAREIGREYIDNGEKNLVKKIDEIMISYYNNDQISELKEVWRIFSFIEDRLILLDAALDAHNSGLYALSVPSLLSQLEGIIIEGYDIKQRVNGGQFKKLVKALFEDKENAVLDFSKELREFYLNFILVDFTHGQEIKSPLSRHAILHGGAKPSLFAKEEVSLKVILMIDSILEQISKLSEEDIKNTKEEIGFK